MTSVRERIDALLDGEDDWIAAMATVACELHHSFEHYHWTGFYRVTAPGQRAALGACPGTHSRARMSASMLSGFAFEA